MHYIIYQITNLVNNKRYIGAHKTTSLDDGYMSSSDVVKHAIKKHGIENFKKEVLFELTEAATMYAKEAELVTASFVQRTDTYNLKPGGYGGWDYVNNISKEEHSARSKYANEFVKNRYNLSQHTEFRFSENIKHRKYAQERAQTQAAKQKRKDTLKRINHSQGKNNSQYGTAFYVNPQDPEVTTRFTKGEAPAGWVLSTVFAEQRMKNSKRWYNDGTRNYYIVLPNPIIEELSLVKGRIKTA